MTKYSEREASTLHIAVGLSLSSLCNLSLNNCHLVSTPVPLRNLSSLTKVSFDSCEFGESTWLSEALDGAIQIRSLVLDSVLRYNIPRSVCQMVGLVQWRIQYTLLSDLPNEFAQLRHLEDLDLSSNNLSCVPTVLEQMTHLRNLDLTCASDGMQLTRPLTFLSAFSNLESFYLSQRAWNSVSSFHIGELQAVLRDSFKHRLPTNKPSVFYSF